MDIEKHSELRESENQIHNRSCTDIFCAVIFILYLTAMFIFAVIGYSQGNLSHIAQPFDSDGNMCGRGNFSEFPLLFIDNPLSISYGNKTVCVSACPKNDTDVPNCMPNLDITNCTKIKAYDSYGFLNRICIPKLNTDSQNFKANVNISYIQSVVQDIKESWPIILVMFLLTIIFCFAYYFLLHTCAPCMVFFMLIGSLASLIVGGVFCWLKYQSLLNNLEAKGATDFKYFAIALWVAAGVLFLLILLLCGRIRLAAQMIDAAADFMMDKKSSLLLPIIAGLAMIFFFAWWLISFLYIFSIGYLRYDQGDIFGDIVWSKQTEAFVWIMLFGLLWVMSFFIANNQHAIAVLASNWYFCRNERGYDISIFTALCWGVSYHIGSLALGSFVIALLWGIQLVLSYMYQQAKQASPDTYIYKVLLCFVNCFERFLQFMNRHAYIEVAIRNVSFCEGIGKSVEIMAGNFARFTVLSVLVELFLFLGGIIMSFLMTVLGYFILMAYGNWRNLEFETIGPLVIFFVLAMLITSLFNNIFEVSADTMLHCYILEETSSGEHGGAYSKCPEKMKRLIAENTEQYQALH